MATQKSRPERTAPAAERRRERPGLGKAAVYALVAAVVLVAGVMIGVSVLSGREQQPAPAGGQPAAGVPKELAGVWWQTRGPELGGTPLLSFGADGTFAVDGEGALDTTPQLEGTYRVEGDTIVLRDSRPGCPEMGWKASPPTDGALVFTITEPASLDCVKAPGYFIEGSEFEYVRISPRSPASAALASGAAEHGPVLRSYGAEPPGGLSDVAGIWLLDGGEHLLRIGADGTYAIADAGTLVTDPDDVGTVELETRRLEEESMRIGTLTFTSGPESRTCSEGTRTVWSEVLVIFDAMAADVPEGACGEVPAGRASWSVVSRTG